MSKISIPFLTICLVSLFWMTPTSAQYNQKATLFTRGSGQGAFLTLVESYALDLYSLNFDNTAYSTCVTGIWLFYDQTNFNTASNGLMEFVFGPSNYCVDFQNLAGRPSSVRFAGSPKDYRADSLTLYQGTYFQGEEEYTYIDLPYLHLDRQAASLIVTGVSPWTLYDGPNYSGQAVCVYPPKSINFTPALIVDLKTIKVPHRTVRSAQKGCWARNEVVAENLVRDGLTHVIHGGGGGGGGGNDEIDQMEARKN